ncbi:ferric enterobactin receptor [Moraxella cuniculi DSM 21768]|uniref:Ferric enterobactin receptor n=1 Tax=Moraxella cuniculi DSM 21768 TaxID=1122245 RepID=A0A1N7DQZ3_9GAMM|nr:FepA family TonB-dependent siderophore receptor [Moraxella cuniculi]OOS05997.1 TonB-dependent siderophore receptor [Moraxella cuniculi]SIR78171.1 ferric enterobactin receptor [Moraxella cuniculi DSM 21768]
MSNFQPKSLALCIFACMSGAAFANATEETAKTTLPTVVLPTQVVTAEAQVKQSLGVSRINQTDLEKRPVQNDVSEILRTMPGVNLTGNAAGAARGNKRQIDIRGMGPENTLILVDGRPVTSRGAERYGRSGERNTRGDSNWVPAEMIESIEVLRGPAAARYGSGAMGGVVNIKTKPTTDEFFGSVNYYTNQPQDDKEGATQRVGLLLSGPLIKDKLGMRLYASQNKTDADAMDINPAERTNNDPIPPLSAGREGVRNKDISARMDWQINDNHKLSFDTGFSRQGNIYNGDTQFNNAGGTADGEAYTKSLNGAETARLYRQNYAITHTAQYGWADGKTVLSYDRTTNSRLKEALAGRTEGSYDSRNQGFTNSVLKNTRLTSELNIPLNFGFEQMLTVGAEVVRTDLNDGASTSQNLSTNRRGQADSYDGIRQDRTGQIKRTSWAVFAEDNIAVAKGTFVVPTVRYNYSSDAGSVVTGGINIAHNITDNLKIKGGIARTYKNPNLYQANPNYMLYSAGRSCRILPQGTQSCYLLGSENLKPETSWNKEIGLEYAKDGLRASIAYFNNDYRNKIVAGTQVLGTTALGAEILQWENSKQAIVEGVEGNLTLPLAQDKLRWVNNFTYMMQSKDKETGSPLSVIPKFTVNSSLNWLVTDNLDANLTYTQYGRQKPRTVPTTPREREEMRPTEVPSYGILGINAGYKWNDAITVRAGVNNVLDKQIKRTNSGARTYNEAGRSYFASIKYQF